MMASCGDSSRMEMMACMFLGTNKWTANAVYFFCSKIRFLGLRFLDIVSQNKFLDIVGDALIHKMTLPQNYSFPPVQTPFYTSERATVLLQYK
jgi:hypothetical protein